MAVVVHEHMAAMTDGVTNVTMVFLEPHIQVMGFDPSSKLVFREIPGRSKNVDTSKFYKILEVDKCQSSVFFFEEISDRLEDRNETNMWYMYIYIYIFAF